VEDEREPFDEALTRVEGAVRAVYRGDPQPFAELWSRAGDVSLFGAFGPARVGWDALEAVFPWVADRYRDGTVEIEYASVWEGAEAALTVGYERAEVSIDGREVVTSTIRITHVFRVEDGRWMLLHRHGDFAPLDDAPHGSGGDG
jgi:ketosteroid isomerase-like protein